MTDSEEFVSVNARPLVALNLDLLERLKAANFQQPNEVQSDPQENGLSCGVCLLSVVLLESFVSRIRYVRNDLVDKKIDAKAYLAEIGLEPELTNDVDEIIAIRDAIAHSHLWRYKVNWGDGGPLRFVSQPELLEGYGNSRLKRVMDQRTRLSRLLQLNLFPPRIFRDDAFRTFKVVWRALEALTEIDPRYFPIHLTSFRFCGQPQTLREITESLP